jgi:hypothetical protein
VQIMTPPPRPDGAIGACNGRIFRELLPKAASDPVVSGFCNHL